MRKAAVHSEACWEASGESRMCMRLMGIAILFFVSASCMKQEEENPEVIQKIHLSESGDVTLDGRPVETEALATALSGTDSVRIGSQIGMPSRQRSQDVVKRYPVRKEVAVYYDPADPRQAVLERGLHGTTFFYFYLGGGIFGFGLLGFLLRNVLGSPGIPAHSPMVQNRHKMD